MNQIQWSKKAVKQLKKLPQKEAEVLYDAATTLEQFPNCQQIKRLINHKYDYRFRVGRYRLLFNYDGEIHIIDIEEVVKRDDNTY